MIFIPYHLFTCAQALGVFEERIFPLYDSVPYQPYVATRKVIHDSLAIPAVQERSCLSSL